jgi:hypothetical protein
MCPFLIFEAKKIIAYLPPPFQVVGREAAPTYHPLSILWVVKQQTKYLLRMVLN